jgi:phenylpropionate dioxygenase-like ring-hydroxylating dioxygenase large terminal subunit
MSNLATAAHLRRATSQLPIPWYCDPSIFEAEQRLLFPRGPGYVGHELMVPNVGDYQSLAWRDDAQVLVRNHNGVELLSNICRHRQAIMLQGPRQCAQHRLSDPPLDVRSRGELLGAPHFAANPCLNLGRSPLQRWNGMLFDGRRDVAADLAPLGELRDFDFSNHVFDRVEVKECNYNWKSFLEVYLEDYHVEPFHPGLGQFVACSDLKWEFGAWYSVQTVGVNKGLAKPGTKAYERWHKAVLEYYRGEIPPHGAIWMVYYPNVMIECYPHVLIVSTLIPRAVDKTTNIVEFYYPEDIALFEREFVEAEQAAYLETAAEDDEIAERMDAGRRALYKAGRSEEGPYQSPLEDGMQHFHEFLRRELDLRPGTTNAPACSTC